MNRESKGLNFHSLNGECCEVVGRGWCFQRDVTVPSCHKKQSVVKIGNAAFKNCKKLNSIVIPEGVIEIGSDAFCGCSSLKSVTLPSTLESIGEGAFSRCAVLTEIKIPQKVKFLKEYTFANCYRLKSIDLSNVQSIGRQAFANCENLDAIDLSAALVIKGEAFLNCKAIQQVRMPDRDCNVSAYAFENCNKKPLGDLWIGNRYIDRLSEAVFKDDSSFEDGVYNLFLDCTCHNDPNEMREMFRIYREVLNNIAGVGLAYAHCMSYLCDGDRSQLAQILFDGRYGMALHKLMQFAAKLYTYLRVKAAQTDEGTDSSNFGKAIQDVNQAAKAECIQERADLFGRLLKQYDPYTGDIGQKHATSSVEFGMLMEHLDEVFNSVYELVESDADRATVKTE